MERAIWGAVLVALPALTFAQPQYEVFDLTKIYGPGFQALGIDEKGRIGGNFFGRPCIAENGAITQLPLIRGHDWQMFQYARNGDAFGASTLGTSTYHSIMYRGGKVFDMNVPGNMESPGVLGMNAVGQATGGALFKGNAYPFIWENGKMTAVPGVPFSHGVAINDQSSIAGRHLISGAYGAGSWINGVFQDLHPMWADESEAVALNEMSEIVGRADQLGVGDRALIWRGGIPTDIGNFGGGHSRAYDINERSQVVGWANASGGPAEGFLWENGNLYRLEDLVKGGTGFNLINRAHHITDAGEILTSGYTGSFNNELLFRPVPEPGTIVTWSGLIAALALRRKFLFSCKVANYAGIVPAPLMANR